MYKKLLLSVLLLLLFLAMSPTFVNSNFVFASTEAEIEISSVEDFVNIPDNTTASYSLVCDLDFSKVSSTYKPKNFCGTLNGNGHTLKNLNIVSKESAGLFLHVSNASISNLNIINFQVYSASSAAALAISISNSTLNNVKVDLGTCYIFGEVSAGKLATNISDCNFIDVTVDNGTVNGASTNELAPVITNTTQEITKPEITDPTPTKPDESETPPEANEPDIPQEDNTNKTDNGKDEEMENGNTSEVKPPESDDNTNIHDVTGNDKTDINGGESGELPPSPPIEDVEPNLPTPDDIVPSNPTPVPDINEIVSIDSTNSQIVVNSNFDAVKIIVICVLVILTLVYGFFETKLKEFIKKHFHKNKKRNFKKS